MANVASYDPVVGLLSAAVLLALMTMTMRRLHRSLRIFMPRQNEPTSPDYGLLVPVATVPTKADADMLREVLASHDIRATIAPATSTGARGPLHVLVFPSDADRARDVVATR